MAEKREKIFSRILRIGLLVSVLWVAFLAFRSKSEESMADVPGDKEQITVVIDAGHGGNDPGKIGANGALEKDINLQIAMILQSFLEANDIRVVMTRMTDEGLHDAEASNKKVQDLRRRIALIEESAPRLVVSIHQNSYHEEYVSGAQVFFYTGSKNGQELAEKIQNRLVAGLDRENRRQVKANDSYYLLKKTARPIVIVECGFLSNNNEAAKLVSRHYQERVAWEIHLGIMQYLNEKD